MAGKDVENSRRQLCDGHSPHSPPFEPPKKQGTPIPWYGRTDFPCKTPVLWVLLFPACILDKTFLPCSDANFPSQCTLEKMQCLDTMPFTTSLDVLDREFPDVVGLMEWSSLGQHGMMGKLGRSWDASLLPATRQCQWCFAIPSGFIHPTRTDTRRLITPPPWPDARFTHPTTDPTNGYSKSSPTTRS